LNRRVRIVLVAGLVLGLSAGAALLAAGSGGGTDDQAAQTAVDLSGGSYAPWAQAPGVPGGDGNGPLLFGLQAGAGLAVIAGCFLYWRDHRNGA
jgi:ABC-type cobalt transport system substrate-binding protein